MTGAAKIEDCRLVGREEFVRFVISVLLVGSGAGSFGWTRVTMNLADASISVNDSSSNIVKVKHSTLITELSKRVFIRAKGPCAPH